MLQIGPQLMLMMLVFFGPPAPNWAPADAHDAGAVGPHAPNCAPADAHDAGALGTTCFKSSPS